MLTGEKPQTLGTRRFQVEKGNIAVDQFDASYPGGNLLLWYFSTALCFRGLEDYIGYRCVAAHQYMAAFSFFPAYQIIVVPDLADFTGDYFCQAFTAVAVAATITEGETGAQTGFKES